MQFKKHQEKILFFSFVGIVQFLILLLNFSPLYLLYLVLINGLYGLFFFRHINKFMIPTIGIVGFCLSIYLSGSHLHTIINDPAYIETINQLRGGSNAFGKIFFNKLTYIYFYFKNLFSYLDPYFWIEKVGYVTFVLFGLSILKFKFNLTYVLLCLSFMLPVGLLVKPLESLSYLLFIPIFSFLIVTFLLKQQKNIKVGLFILLIAGLMIQILWPVRVII